MPFFNGRACPFSALIVLSFGSFIRIMLFLLERFIPADRRNVPGKFVSKQVKLIRRADALFFYSRSDRILFLSHPSEPATSPIHVDRHK